MKQQKPKQAKIYEINPPYSLQQKPKQKICGYYNCPKQEEIRQQTALAIWNKCLNMVRKMLNIKTCNNYLPEDMFSDIEAEIKKLSNQSSAKPSQ